MKKRKTVRLLKKSISVLLIGAVILTMTGLPICADESSNIWDETQVQISREWDEVESLQAVEEAGTEEKSELKEESITSSDNNDISENSSSDDMTDSFSDSDQEENKDTYLSAEEDTLTEEIPSPTVAEEEQVSVTVEEPDSTTGMFTVRISGIVLETGEKLIVPIWNKSDQSDLVWYTAVKNGTDYIVQSDPSRHAYGTGTYNIHVYLRDISMNTKLLTKTSLKLMPSADTLNANVSGDSIEVVLDGTKEYGTVSSVIYAVWTAKNGQDDLAWYTAAQTSERSWEKRVPLDAHSDTGACYVHAYVKTKAGKMICVRTTAIELSGPSVQEITVAGVDSDTGDFTITVSDVQEPSGLKSVIVPIWSKADQSDLVWYTAVKQGNDYVVSGNISKHSWHTGTYQVHVYLKNTKGQMHMVGITSMKALVSADSVSATMGEDGKSADVFVKGLRSCGSFSKIVVAVWSQANGQDDLRWYTGNNIANGNFSKTISMSDHTDAGTYYLHFYMKGKDGTSTFIGATKMEVQENAVEKYSVETSGKSITIQVEGIFCIGGIEKVLIPVWSQADQSDIVWYTAVRENGTDNWVVRSDISKHKNHTGIYHAHLYVLNTNGQMILLGQKDFQISLVGLNGIEITDADGTSGTFKVRIMTGAIQTEIADVQVAIWSEGDQSDIKWYDADQDGDGQFSVTMNVRNHQEHFGTYYVHAYAYDSNGTATLIATESTTLAAENYVYANRVSDSEYEITIFGPTINEAATASVVVPTWSDTNGQDDLVWYQAEKGSNGGYSVIVERAEHAHDGSFTSDIYVSDAAGNMSMVQRVNYTLTSEVQKFSDSAKEVMHNIIYAVETGGQVYGNKRYDCFVQAYTNSSNEKAITIGAGGWYGTEAKHLLSLIRSAYPDTFDELDTAGIGDDLDNEDWTTYGGDGAGGRTILSGSDKAIAIQAIINTEGGQAIQDSLVDDQMTIYVGRAEDLGVTDLKARMFCANIHHLGGYSAMKRIINYCIDDGLELTMDNLWTDMRAHESGAGNKVGSDLYASRHRKVMQWLNTYIG